MADGKTKFIEYMCRYCGKKVTRGVNAGRPEPGTCPRRKMETAHSWLINRRFK